MADPVCGYSSQMKYLLLVLYTNWHDVWLDSFLLETVLMSVSWLSGLYLFYFFFLWNKFCCIYADVYCRWCNLVHCYIIQRFILPCLYTGKMVDIPGYLIQINWLQSVRERSCIKVIQTFSNLQCVKNVFIILRAYVCQYQLCHSEILSQCKWWLNMELEQE